MKTVISFAALAISLTAATAAETYVSPVSGKPFKEGGKLTLEQVKERDQKIMQKTGGFIVLPAEGPRALLVDARAKPGLTIDEVGRLYTLGTHLKINLAKDPRGDKDPLVFAQAKMADTNNLLAVVVIDNESRLPALSVFPEERIGLVNADKLQGGDDPSAPETRVAKEIWRAIGFIGGIGFSAQPNDMMQPYYTLKELDGNVQAYIQPMNMMKMKPMLNRFGVKKDRRVPYRAAAQQGWAPSPTNDIQKAVWDEVHAIPKTPLKIKYDADAKKPTVTK